MTEHLMVNPPEMAASIGFSHAIVAGPGRTVYLAGQISFDAESQVIGETWPEQFDHALGNLVTALGAAEGKPEHITWIQLFTCDVPGYRENHRELGPIWQRHMGRHFPAMGLFGVTELAEEQALVEITGIAVIPD